MKLTESKLRKMVRKMLRENEDETVTFLDSQQAGIEAGKHEEIEEVLAEMLEQPAIEMAMELGVELSENNVTSIANQVARHSAMVISDELRNAILNRS